MTDVIMLDDVQRRSSYSTPQAIWVSQNTTSGWSLPVKQGGSNETIGRGTTFAENNDEESTHVNETERNENRKSTLSEEVNDRTKRRAIEERADFKTDNPFD
ncbi:hypothetical protein HZH68_015261 [Vespula germanica]|uniref:Uncharacterized protein n=1 Tax=Vespula germanica TaxID=30212 RepID=A0A834J6E1_VESGE|nr:hypothetical protein HZH68_015261 [Vespula germanica]